MSDLIKKYRPLLGWAVVIICIYAFIHSDERKQDQGQPQNQKLLLAESVSVLPSGAEAAWKKYVDKRMEKVLHRDGNTIQLISSNQLGDIVYVSANAPYEIDCGTIGADISFMAPQSVSEISDNNGGEGFIDNDLSVNIYGDMSSGKTPPLGVNVNSVAAKTLRKNLCQYIVERMQEITGQRIKVISPQGTTGTIPADQLKDALKAGYKKINASSPSTTGTLIPASNASAPPSPRISSQHRSAQ